MKWVNISDHWYYETPWLERFAVLSLKLVATSIAVARIC